MHDAPSHDDLNRKAVHVHEHVHDNVHVDDNVDVDVLVLVNVSGFCSTKDSKRKANYVPGIHITLEKDLV